MSDHAIAVIQSAYAAFGRGDIPAILSALTADCDWRVNGRRSDFPLFGVWAGPAEIAEFFRLVGEYEEFSEFSPREIFAAGDRVVALGHYSLTIRKTGRGVSCDWVHVFTMLNGKIAGFKEFTDTAQFVGESRH